MSQIVETRRAAVQGKRKRGSECVVADASEYSRNPIAQQAAWLSQRYAVSPALAKVVAELAFAKGVAR